MLIMYGYEIRSIPSNDELKWEAYNASTGRREKFKTQQAACDWAHMQRQLTMPAGLRR